MGTTEKPKKQVYKTKRPHRYAYKTEYCDKIPELYKSGESDAEVALALKVPLHCFKKWLQEHEDFYNAVLEGRGYSEAWWHKLGRIGAAGKIKIQPFVWYANMKNRFGWRDQVTVEDCHHLQLNDTLQEMKRLIALQKKHEKEY